MGSVNFQEFLSELQQEYVYFSEDKESYRLKTVEFSLEVANKVKELSPFLNRSSSEETVSALLPKLDKDRTSDVAKMLRVVANELILKEQLSDEVKMYVKGKQEQIQGNLSFVKK